MFLGLIYLTKDFVFHRQYWAWRFVITVLFLPLIFHSQNWQKCFQFWHNPNRKLMFRQRFWLNPILKVPVCSFLLVTEIPMKSMSLPAQWNFDGPEMPGIAISLDKSPISKLIFLQLYLLRLSVKLLTDSVLLEAEYSFLDTLRCLKFRS